MELTKIAVVTCFFGDWPAWAELFINSCNHNPSVDFFLISDCKPRKPLATNVKLVEFDLARFKALATERLGVEVVFEKPHKLCDFKPTWGVLFQELLSDYDFWGHCDHDVIFGDIRAFLSEELLRQHDVICARQEWMTGHFTLYRNRDFFNRLYERSRDYQKVFGGMDTEAFDECGHGLFEKLLQGASFADVADEANVDAMMQIISRTPGVRLLLRKLCDEWMQPRLNQGVKARRFRWENGKLFEEVTGKELMYVHMWRPKRQKRLFTPRWPQLPHAFRLTEHGFFWIGRQPLWQRLATASQRALYFFGRSLWVIYRNARFGLPRSFAAWRDSRQQRRAHAAS